MTIKSVQFVKSASSYSDCIVSDLPQIALIGRSNVGKSSFLNLFSGQNLARVSKQPGRTKLINYFLVNDSFFLVDLPGYGYAEVSKSEKEKWGALIESYLEKEQQLKHVLFLLDIRHAPTQDDILMYNYIFSHNLPFTVIATKSDKLPKSQIPAFVAKLATALKLGSADVIPVSTLNAATATPVLSRLDRLL